MINQDNINNAFDIPVVLFIFKRHDTVLRILDRLKDIQPEKLYLIGDGPRNEEESFLVNNTRKIIETSITWECKIIKNYSLNNRGVYENIGRGANWVFEREKEAIFLEDDNLPDISFFPFCKELLIKYRDNTEIFWICGTNYLKEYNPKNGASYMFTRNLLPCGWASWANKFTQYYDGELKSLNEKFDLNSYRDSYLSKSLFKQQKHNIKSEHYRIENGLKPVSWDYQMAFSIRKKNLLGVSPKNNLIKNIGVDEYSIHGGSSYSNEMTNRFCGIPTKSLDFPLIHPNKIEIDKNFELMIERIILNPFKVRIRAVVARFIKRILGVSIYEKYKH